LKGQFLVGENALMGGQGHAKLAYNTRQAKTMKTKLLIFSFASIVLSGVIIASAPADFSIANAITTGPDPTQKPLPTREEITEEQTRFLGPGMVAGTGTHFRIEGSDYLDVILESSETVQATIESIPRMVSMTIEAADAATAPNDGTHTTELTLEGLAPDTTYSLYNNSHKNKAVFVADEYGSYSWTQDLTQPHHIWLHEAPSGVFAHAEAESDDTIYIPDQCSEYGVWDAATATCTLTQDVTKGIEITENDVTLDCRNHRMDDLLPTWISYGIYLNNKSSFTLKNCIIGDSLYAVYLNYSDNNTFSRNIVSGNAGGFDLTHSSNNRFTDNAITDNSYRGISLRHSSNNFLRRNHISNNGYNFNIGGGCGSSGGITVLDYTHDIDTSNMVNGRPIYYLVNEQDKVIDATMDIGYLGVINSQNITVKDLTLENNGHGVLFAHTTDSRIENITAANNDVGILLIEADNNYLSENILTENSNGICIESSNNNVLEASTVSDNRHGGMDLWRTSQSILRDNIMIGNRYNFHITGSYADYHYHHDIDVSNTINGRPMYYLVGERDRTIDAAADPGYIAAVDSTNIVVQDVTLTNNGGSIVFVNTTDSRIENVTVSQNGWYGIGLIHARNNVLQKNTFFDIQNSGIYMSDADNNLLSGNTFSDTGGIYLSSSDENTINNNTIKVNYARGVTLSNSDENILQNNHIVRRYCIDSPPVKIKYFSHNNTLSNNIITYDVICDKGGVEIDNRSNNNLIYHNNIKNAGKPIDDSGTNSWENGYPMGGNYWSDYTGVDEEKGTNQDEPGSDGIGDTPYVFEGGQDSYPFMEENGWLEDGEGVFDVAVILAEPSDVAHEARSITAQPCKLIPEKTYADGHGKEYYEDLAHCVVDYHKENSFGTVNLNFTIYDNEGAWFETDRTEKNYYALERIFVRDALQLATSKNLDLLDKDMVIVVHSGTSSQRQKKGSKFTTSTWPPDSQPLGSPPYKIITAEDDPVGIWAHEIGHVLGIQLTPENTAVPDLYKMGDVKKWDVMGTGSWNEGGANPPYMSSYTKEFLGWLHYDIHPKSAYGEHWINSLETSNYGDSVFRYNVSDDINDASHKYYILEARNRDLKTWDSSLPGLPVVGDKHLVLYYVDTKGLSEYGYVLEGTDSYQKGMMWNQYRSITIPGNNPEGGMNDGILSPSINETYRDLDNLVKFSAITDRSVDSRYEMQARIEEITNDSFNDQLWGAVLRPGSFLMDKIKGFLRLNAPPLASTNLPDLDLHLYTDDGKHIGMNYATGEYEVEIVDAIVSGDNQDAPEWIFVPQEVTNYHFVVSSFDNQQFLEEHPEIAQELDDTTDTYEVYARHIDPAGTITTSETITEDIALGENLQQDTQGTIDITISPATPLSVKGDINGDCQVDGRDIRLLRTKLGSIRTETDRKADLNNDGVITPKDGVILRDNLGNGCTIAQTAWPILGDVTFDCVVSIQDLIFIRNRLKQDATEGDNWKADVNKDGAINALDIRVLRRHLGARCE